MNTADVGPTSDPAPDSGAVAAGDLRDHVRRRYAAAATVATGARAVDTCCGPETNRSAAVQDGCSDAADAGEGFGVALYGELEREGLPGPDQLASLGCGNPTAVAELEEGETVLDLGSGGGLDVLLSARRVGPSGFAYGLDMTPEMLALARRNAEEAGVDNVEFLEGQIEDIPLADGTIDVIISNCVINLSVDKPAVMAQMARVLVPGGRLGISDVVAEDRLEPAERAQRGSYVGCIAGALSVTEYRQGLEAVGLVDVEVVFTHEVADGLHGAIIRARRSA